MTTLIIIGSILLTIMVTLFIFVLSIKFDPDHNALTSSFHYKLFNILRCANDEDVPPKTICIYYWKYVQYIISLPLTMFLIIINLFIKLKNRVGTNILYPLSILTWLPIALIMAFGKVWYLEENVSILKIVIAGITSLILLGLLGTLLYFIIESVRKISTRKRYKPKTNPMLKLRFKAWKEKNCPIINWK